MNGAIAKRITATSFAQPADEICVRGRRLKPSICSASAISMPAKGSSLRKRPRNQTALQLTRRTRLLHEGNGIRSAVVGRGLTETSGPLSLYGIIRRSMAGFFWLCIVKFLCLGWVFNFILGFFMDSLGPVFGSVLGVPSGD
ncbi:hypothetical protein BDV32DRAFT_125037, partial [Aspergillus pseudonomiae]